MSAVTPVCLSPVCSRYYCDMGTDAAARGDHHWAPGHGGIFWPGETLNKTRRNLNQIQILPKIRAIISPKFTGVKKVTELLPYTLKFKLLQKWIWVIFTHDHHNLHCAVSPGESWAASFIRTRGKNSLAQRGQGCQMCPPHNTLAAICLCTSAVTASYV